MMENLIVQFECFGVLVLYYDNVVVDVFLGVEVVVGLGEFVVIIYGLYCLQFNDMLNVYLIVYNVLGLFLYMVGVDFVKSF